VKADGTDLITTAGGAWQHLSFVWDGSAAVGTHTRIYINGVDIGAAVAGTGVSRRSDAAMYKYAGTTLDGKLTEHAIFSTELSSTDINDIMDFGLDQSVAATTIIQPIINIF